jgi:hypothetical protein
VAVVDAADTAVAAADVTAGKTNETDVKRPGICPAFSFLWPSHTQEENHYGALSDTKGTLAREEEWGCGGVGVWETVAS